MQTLHFSITMKYYFTLLLFIVSFSKFYAQAPKEKALLWKISGNQLKSPSYLYGTYHLLCPDDLKLSDKVKDAVKASSKVYLELDFDDPEMMQKMQANMLMEGDASIKNLLPDSTFQKASRSFLTTTGISLEMLSKMKPILLSVMLYPSLMKCELASPEQLFSTMAAEQNKSVEGLETVEEQMKVMDQIPYAEQAQMLVDYLLEPEKFSKETLDILKQYKEGDLAALEKSMNDPNQSYSKYLEGMLLQRNRNWIPIIIKQSTENPIFIAVGAGHLAGEEGVISLLRKQGYTVSPL